jgi:hypothetical protein
VVISCVVLVAIAVMFALWYSPLGQRIGIGGPRPDR